MIERGVRANVVAPGPVCTVLQPSGGQPQQKAKSAVRRPDLVGRGNRSNSRPFYVLPASREGSDINGEVYGVTGGVGWPKL